jgi:hypothetical protein
MVFVDDLTASSWSFSNESRIKAPSLRTSTDNHAVRLVDMEHHSNMRVVNTDTKGAGRDHFLLEETTAE